MKNTHLEHLEDNILNGGSQGGREAVAFLRSLGDMLDQGAADTRVTVKWDGAPAIICGVNPENGRFFVGTKSVFNKVSPKISYSEEDVDSMYSAGQLAEKLKDAYKYLSTLSIPNVVQGDLLFTDDKYEAVIGGENCIAFQPNTIVYAVPVGSKLEKTISKAKIGIVWHTSYSGGTFETMQAEFGGDIVGKLKKSSNVWMVNAELEELSGKATFTQSDNLKVTSLLSAAGKMFQKISSGVLKEIEQNKELNLVINVYNNTMVRKGVRITNTRKHASGLIKFVEDRYAKQIDKRTSRKGKDIQIKKRDELLAFFSKKNLKNLQNVFDLQNLIVDSKLIIINKLNKLNNIGTFVKTTSGFKVTNPEGFVAVDRMEGGAVKLVDRLEFSANNFSKDIIKGWDNPN